MKLFSLFRIETVWTGVFCLALLGCGSGGSDVGGAGADGIYQISELPNRALTAEEVESITINCDDYPFSSSAPTEERCAVFSMRSSDTPDRIESGGGGFSEQDLMDRLEIMFPDFDTAPVIVIEGDGVLEDGLVNNGFHIYLV